MSTPHCRTRVQSVEYPPLSLSKQAIVMLQQVLCYGRHMLKQIPCYVSMLLSWQATMPSYERRAWCSGAEAAGYQATAAPGADRPAPDWCDQVLIVTRHSDIPHTDTQRIDT